jgi:acyl dehydratase
MIAGMPLSPALYLEDLSVGQRFTSRSHTFDADQIVRFARDYDPQVFHLDAEAAKDTFFKGLVASGWHTASVSMRLFVESTPIAGGLIGAGGEVAWPRPTYPGDTVHLESEITGVTPSRSRPDRGIVAIRSEIRNQNGEVVQVLHAKIVVPRRPPAAG